jgi:hypothetical protein
MSMVGFPLLLIPFAIYNIIALLMPSVSFDVTLAKLTLVSGAEWPITLSDVLLTLGILLLLLEVMKSARPGGKYITDHLLSFLVLGATAAEFVMWQKFGTSTFFLLVLMAMVDFFSGIALRGRRAVAQPASRTVAARREPGKAREDAKREDAKREDPKQDEKTVPVEPHVEPAPAADPAASAPASQAPATTSAVPPAASVAESVLMDRPEPKRVRPEAIKPVVLTPEPKPAEAAVEVTPPAPESQPAPPVEAEHIEAEEIKEIEAREIAAQEKEAQKIEAQAAPAAAEPSSQGSSEELHPGSSPPASPETPKH